MKIIVLISLFALSFLISFALHHSQANTAHNTEVNIEQNAKHNSEQLDIVSAVSSPKGLRSASTTTSANKGRVDLSLQELAYLVDVGASQKIPWLSAKVNYVLAEYTFAQLQNLHEQLSISNLAGTQKLLSLIVFNMAQYSSIDTLRYLFSNNTNRNAQAHINEVIKNLSGEESVMFADWVLSQEFDTVISPNRNFLADLFARTAVQSTETTMAYLSRAHTDLKQHILAGLLASFSQFQQYQALMNFIATDENKMIKNGVVTVMARQYPIDTANWLDNQPIGEYAESVYLDVFIAQLKTEFVKAANWYFKHSKTNVREAIENIFMFASLKYNPEILLTWAQRLPSEHQQYALAVLLFNYAGKDPEFVLQHYDKVHDKKERRRIGLGMFHVIRKNTPDQLERFINQSEFSQELLELDARYKANGQ